MWSIDADLSAVMSVAATAEYGTERIGGVRLFELALNLKSPAIYDTVMAGGKEERVLNQEATLAAREKQKRIKEKLSQLDLSEPERTERLVGAITTSTTIYACACSMARISNSPA